MPGSAPAGDRVWHAYALHGRERNKKQSTSEVASESAAH